MSERHHCILFTCSLMLPAIGACAPAPRPPVISMPRCRTGTACAAHAAECKSHQTGLRAEAHCSA